MSSGPKATGRCSIWAHTRPCTVSCHPEKGQSLQLSHWVCMWTPCPVAWRGTPESINEDQYSNHFYARKLFTWMPEHVSLSEGKLKVQRDNGNFPHVTRVC